MSLIFGLIHMFVYICCFWNLWLNWAHHFIIDVFSLAWKNTSLSKWDCLIKLSTHWNRLLSVGPQHQVKTQANTVGWRLQVILSSKPSVFHQAFACHCTVSLVVALKVFLLYIPTFLSKILSFCTKRVRLSFFPRKMAWHTVFALLHLLSKNIVIIVIVVLVHAVFKSTFVHMHFSVRSGSSIS